MGDQDTISILIATDNHLGYAERDILRANDSFDTFEEILQLARQHKVDALLLGGDLFHENRPSRKTLHRTFELLRHYCLGYEHDTASKESSNLRSSLKLLSDPSVNFAGKFGTVNYLDPNYKVALPVFAIHGNHDDPTGEGNLGSLDLLSVAGLINYFGKMNSVDEINLHPVLLSKGITKLALYGLGAVRDERLHRTFLQHRVHFVRPPSSPEEWFNMMILHQNRVAHTPTSYIPEHFLADFLDLVVWGHEHECLACDPTSCPERGFTVCQPGSSVATSLSEGETRGKHVVILRVQGRHMTMLPIPLATVRPFLMREVILRDVRPRLEIHDSKGINQFLVQQVEELISQAQEEWRVKQDTTDPELVREFPLPLIRLRVDYSARSLEGLEEGEPGGDTLNSTFAIMNPLRFGQRFTNRIANPRDVVYFVRKRATPNRRVNKNEISATRLTNRERNEAIRVEDLVHQFLNNQKLDLFPQNEFTDIVRLAVEKDDREAIETFVKQSLSRTVTIVGIHGETGLDRDVIKGEFERSKKLREDEWMRLHPAWEDLINTRMRPIIDNNVHHGDRGDEDDMAMNSDQENRENMAISTGTRRSRNTGDSEFVMASNSRKTITQAGDHNPSIKTTTPNSSSVKRRTIIPKDDTQGNKQGRLEFSIFPEDRVDFENKTIADRISDTPQASPARARARTGAVWPR